MPMNLSARQAAKMRGVGGIALSPAERLDLLHRYIAACPHCQSCGRGVLGFTTKDALCGACAVGMPELRGNRIDEVRI